MSSCHKFIDDYVAAGRLAEEEQGRAIRDLGPYLTLCTPRDFVWAVRIVGSALVANREGATDRIQRLAHVVSTDGDRRRWLVQLVKLYTGNTSAYANAGLVSDLWWFGDGFPALTSMDVDAVRKAHRGQRARAAALAIRARAFGLNRRSLVKDEVEATRKALLARKRPEVRREDADLQLRLDLTRQLFNMGLPFATGVAGVVVAARASNRDKLDAAWDAMLPVKQRQSIAREWMDGFAPDWHAADQNDRALLQQRLQDMLGALDPAFESLSPTHVAPELAAMGRRQGAPATLARLAIACSGLGFRCKPGESTDAAVRRAQRQLLRSAPPR